MKKTTIRLTPEIEELLENLARWEERSKSDMIRALIIREHVDFQTDMEKYPTKKDFLTYVKNGTM